MKSCTIESWVWHIEFYSVLNSRREVFIYIATNEFRSLFLKLSLLQLIVAEIYFKKTRMLGICF